MGRTSPLILRSGHLFNNWKSHWFSDANYTNLLTEDLKIRYYINNVNYYLKLPSSDLKIRRPQNLLGIMYNSYYLPEYIRVDKLNSYKFSFYRYNIKNLEINTNLVKKYNNNKQKTALDIIILWKLLSKTSSLSRYLLKLFKYYLINRFYLNHTTQLYYTNNLTNLIMGDTLLGSYKILISYKKKINNIYNFCSFTNSLSFSKNLISKIFNSNYNLTNLFELFSAEDIVLRDAARDAEGRSIIYETKRRSYTATSIVLLDSFGKTYEYEPQKTRRKYPFYDFFFFFKLNLVHILKMYSHYNYYKKRKRKRYKSLKKLKKKYFIRYVMSAGIKIKKLKLYLGNLIELQNKVKDVYAQSFLHLKGNYSKYILNGKTISDAFNKKLSLRSYLFSLLHNAYIHNKPIANKTTYNRLYRQKKKTHLSNIKFVKILKFLNKFIKNNMNFRNKQWLINSVQMSLNSNLLKVNIDKYRMQTINNSLNSYNFFKSTHHKLFATKARVVELVNYYWTKLNILSKLVISKFRRVKVLKKDYYDDFKRSQYISNIFSNKSLNDIIINNLYSDNLLLINNVKFNSSISIHPIFKWVYSLINIKDAYKNKMSHYNRYLWSNHKGLRKISKIPYYFLKLRRKKQFKVDKSDIRYMPKNWHKLLEPRKKKEHEENISKKDVRNYLKGLTNIAKVKTYHKLRKRLKLITNRLLSYKKYNIIALKLLSHEESSKIKSKLVIRTILRYFQRLITVKKKVTSKFIKLLKKVELKNKRSYKAKERKLRHLYYVRWLAKTLKSEHSIYYKTIYFLVKPYIIRRFRKATRDPSFFYARKKRKLPLELSLKQFKKKLAKKRANMQKYKSRQWNTVRRQRTPRYNNIDMITRNYRLAYWKKKKSHNIILKYKKIALDNFNQIITYKYQSFKQKLLNLLVTRNKSRFIIFSSENQLLSKYLFILKGLSKKQFFRNLQFSKRNRDEIIYNHSSKLNYEGIINKNEELDNNIKISSGYLLRHLKQYLPILLKNDIIKQVLEVEDTDNLKIKHIFTLLYIMKIVIRANLQNIKYKNYLKTINKKIESCTKTSISKSYSNLLSNSNSKLYRTYCNYKLRTKAKILRSRYQYKEMLSFLYEKDNKLVYNFSYLKRLIHKITSHISFLLTSNANNYVKKKYGYYSNADSPKYQHNTINQNKNYIVQSKTVNSCTKNFSKTIINNVNKIINKVTSSTTKRTLIRRYLKDKKTSSILLNTINKEAYLNNTTKKIKQYLHNLYYLFFKSTLNLNNKYLSKPEQKMSSDIKKIYKKYAMLNNIGLKTTLDFAKSKQVLENTIKAKSKNRIYSNSNLKIQHYVLNGTRSYLYSKGKLLTFKYIYDLVSIYHQLYNHLYSKLKILKFANSLDDSHLYTFYKCYYHYIFNSFYTMTTIMHAIIKSLYIYISSNIYKNIVEYIRHNLLIKCMNVKNGVLANITYDAKKYSYYNSYSKLIYNTLKKNYSVNTNNNICFDYEYKPFRVTTDGKLSNCNRYNNSLISLHNISTYLDENIINYLQLNYTMEYDTNKLIKSKENFLYFYNIYTYNYDYNCMFLLNPRLLCEYFVYAIKNKVQYYEIYSDIREGFSDLRRLQIILKKIYDRILYRLLHGYLDCLIDWNYLQLKNYENKSNLEYTLFYKKLRTLTILFSYLIYTVGIRNHINICGLHIKTGGRRSRKLRTHTRLYQRGRMSLNTFADDIDYYFKPVFSRFGTLGTKIFIYREPSFRIPLLHIMYRTLFLRFRLLRLLVTNNINEER